MPPSRKRKERKQSLPQTPAEGPQSRPAQFQGPVPKKGDEQRFRGRGETTFGVSPQTGQQRVREPAPKLSPERRRLMDAESALARAQFLTPEQKRTQAAFNRTGGLIGVRPGEVIPSKDPERLQMIAKAEAELSAAQEGAQGPQLPQDIPAAAAQRVEGELPLEPSPGLAVPEFGPDAPVNQLSGLREAGPLERAQVLSQFTPFPVRGGPVLAKGGSKLKELYNAAKGRLTKKELVRKSDDLGFKPRLNTKTYGKFRSLLVKEINKIKADPIKAAKFAAFSSVSLAGTMVSYYGLKIFAKFQGLEGSGAASFNVEQNINAAVKEFQETGTVDPEFLDEIRASIELESAITDPDLQANIIETFQGVDFDESADQSFEAFRQSNIRHQRKFNDLLEDLQGGAVPDRGFETREETAARQRSEAEVLDIQTGVR